MIQIRRSAVVRYTPAQMFDLVNDVEAYPTRFAWCAAARVLARDEHALTARLDLRYAGITQRFTTRNTMTPPGRLQLDLVEGPFRSLHGDWTFVPLGPAGCKVELELDFEYAGGLAGPLLRLGFQSLASRMVDDFCRVAGSVYG
ncbi:MAG TPA: type II toxin-antitoxin system RatA family toxin [Rhodanobacteraceae bacterium]|nr:type II toxin-antitoxin system RatA family toxin [Rhodanobacteraceae bacterium]